MALPYVYLLSVLSMRYYHPEDSGHVNLYISGYEDTLIDYTLPWEEETRRVALNEANDRRWSASFKLTTDQEDACLIKAIQVKTSKQVTIQVSRGKLQLTNTAAYTAIPLTESSKEFLISSQPNAEGGLKGSQPIFVIGAGSKEAKVKIYNKFAEEKSSFLFSRTLSPYEMLEIPGGLLNITGIYLSSDKPIVVYSGHQCANVPMDANFCEPLLQQVPPFSLIGTEYIMGPIKQRDDAGYTARIITTKQGSDVILATKQGRLLIENANIRGCTLTDLGEVYNVQCRSPLGVGTYIDVHTTPSTLPLVVKCSTPCYVYQMNRGGSEPSIGVRSDPFMALVPPLTQKAAFARFSTVSSFASGRELFFRNFVSVIAPRNKIVLLDDIILPPNTGYTVGDYKVYSGEIEHGFHVVKTSDGEVTNLVVQLYGHGPSSQFTGRSAYGLAATYFESIQEEFEPEFVSPKSTFSPRTLTSSPPTRTRPVIIKTTRTTTDLPRFATDVISTIVTLPPVSPSKAVTTGILAAIAVAVIIIILCCVIMALILIILRRRRNKCKALITDTPKPVMAVTNTVVCVKDSGEITTLKSALNDPDYWKMHDLSCVLKPKYDDTYDYIDKPEPEFNISGDEVEDPDYVEVALPSGEMYQGCEKAEMEGYQAKQYENLDGIEAHDNNSYDILNPSTV